ncbi:uncharacterized protein LOC124329236 [Daphnia pulicaria]|uniref:uncharacterized protein LOC124329236 n=1 Tax=Daphnia pulicaria TaxID=35523 RepID=UPI001EEC8E11|nr:uncharacterized protein LOC124329236 [Daphnia pulicaria]
MRENRIKEERKGDKNFVERTLLTWQQLHCTAAFFILSVCNHGFSSKLFCRAALLLFVVVSLIAGSCTTATALKPSSIILLPRARLLIKRLNTTPMLQSTTLLPATPILQLITTLKWSNTTQKCPSTIECSSPTPDTATTAAQYLSPTAFFVVIPVRNNG